MRSFARFAAAAGVGLHRARHGGARTALVVVGVGAAAFVLAGVLLASTRAGEQTLAQAVDRLAPPERVVRAAWFGVPAQADSYATLDAAARRELARVISGAATATVLFRESSVGGAYVSLGAVDGLRSWVRLTRGRLPRTCTAERCEVVQLRGSGRVPRRFAVVGRGRLRTTALFGDAVPADRNELERTRLAPALQRVARYHQPALPPLLLASAVRTLTRLPELATSYRSYGWVTPIRGDELRPWDVEPLARETVTARGSLQSRSVGFDVAAPVEELLAARERSRVGARRLLLLGGEGAALLLAFAAFAATRLRRPARASDRRLALAGVTLWQRAAAVGTHALALAAGGVLAAWVVAFAAAELLGHGELASHSLVALDGLVAAAALAAGAVAAVVVVLTVERVRGLDAVAVALAVAVAAALARGVADADELLRRGGSGAVLLALPIAVAAIAGIVVARTVAPVMRTAERRLPPAALGPRLAALSLARRPGTAALASAFLVVSVALALFAGAYRSTLERGQRDQAAFALGADLVLREDLRRLVPVRRVATPERLRALGADAAPVLRASANVPGLAGATGVTVLGLEPRLLERVRGAEVPARDLHVRAGSVGPQLPVDARTLTIVARATTPGVALEAAVRGPSGAYMRLPIAAGRADVPPQARGGRVVALRIVPPPRLQERGADAGRAVSGVATLGPLEADGRIVVDDYAGWIGVGGASFRGGRLVYTLSNQVETWFRPRQPLDGVAVPALVSPTLAPLADARGRLPLQVAGRHVVFRVTATVRRFPSTRGDFAVADRATLEAALDLVDPGSGFATEAWVNAGDAATERRLRAQLRRPPFDALELDSRVERERELRTDPLARGSLAMLAVAAGAALLLALLALALTTLSDLRDDHDELLDLEAQGASPQLLRRVVRLRQVAVALIGLVGGIVAGLALAALVVDVVAVSAGGAAPVPPLRLSVDAAQLAVGFAAAATAGAALVVTLTRRAFGEGDAGRPREAEA